MSTISSSYRDAPRAEIAAAVGSEYTTPASRVLRYAGLELPSGRG